jgi:hypothetical protein
VAGAGARTGDRGVVEDATCEAVAVEAAGATPEACDPPPPLEQLPAKAAIAAAANTLAVLSFPERMTLLPRCENGAKSR